VTDTATPRPGGKLLLDRNLGPYLAGNTLSGMGMWFQNLAAALLIFDLTGSTLMVGVVNFSLFIGALLLVSVTGAAADRFDRRRLLMVTQGVGALAAGALAVFTLMGVVTTGLLIASTALLGLALAFFPPAMLSLVPLLVPRADLDTALAINSASFNLARAVGPVLAAWVIEQLGYGAAFAINAATFLAFIVLLSTVHPRAVTGGRPTTRPRLREAIATVRASETLPALLGVIAVASMASDPVYTLTPELAIEVFGGTEQTTGWLVGAFGAGAVLSAILIVPRLKNVPYILGQALVVLGVGMGILAVAPTLPIALAGMAIAGAGFLISLTRATTRIQNAVPEDQLGRVMALWSVCFIGTRPVVALIDGAIAELIHPRVAAGTMALMPLAMAFWIRAILRPRLRAAEAARRGVVADPDTGAYTDAGEDD
jgi:MFS family permease